MAFLGMAALGATAFAAPTLAGSEFRNKYDSVGDSRDCDEGDLVAYGGPLALWPPNHKMQPVSITATDGDGAGQITLEVIPGADEATNGQGDGNTETDWEGTEVAATEGDGSVTIPFSIRSERSGGGDGRVYTLDFTAEYDDGKVCTSRTGEEAPTGPNVVTVDPFIVEVPHDMRGGANW